MEYYLVKDTSKRFSKISNYWAFFNKPWLDTTCDDPEWATVTTKEWYENPDAMNLSIPIDVHSIPVNIINKLDLNPTTPIKVNLSIL